MAVFSYSLISTLVTPGGTITFNATSGDTLFVDAQNGRGLGSFDTRAPVDPKGQTSGYILHPFFLPGAQIILPGIFLIRSAGDEAGYLSARDTLMNSTYAALKSAAATTTSTLNFTGGSSIAGLKVRRSDFNGGTLKNFIIDLVGTDLP